MKQATSKRRKNPIQTHHTVEKAWKRESKSVFSKDIYLFLKAPSDGYLMKRQLGAPGHTQRLLSFKAALLEE